MSASIVQTVAQSERSVTPVFQHEMKKELTKDRQLIYFKVYKGQMRVIEQAIETAPLIPRHVRPEGSFLQIVCTDFLAGESSIDGRQIGHSSPCRPLLRLGTIPFGRQPTI